MSFFIHILLFLYLYIHVRIHFTLTCVIALYYHNSVTLMLCLNVVLRFFYNNIIVRHGDILLIIVILQAFALKGLLNQFTGWIYLLGSHVRARLVRRRHKLEPITRISLSYLV